MSTISKQEYFDELISSVNLCDLCPRLCKRKKVLSALNGNISSKVLFIAEAPGRLGAECSGVPLYGDATGNNFEMLLSNIGWERQDVFITNAILCNPQDENGNNATPTKAEVENCSYYLNMVLELVKPEVVVTLGVKALEALNNIEKHSYSLNRDVAKLLPWHGMKVFPLYHMSPRAMIHRPIIKQRADFIALSHEVSPTRGLKKNRTFMQTERTDSKKQPKLVEMVEYIVSTLGELSFFKLTKLLFLIDYHYLADKGNTMSNAIYLRMQEGPWIPYLKDIVRESKAIHTITRNRKPTVVSNLRGHIKECSLSHEEKHFIDQYVERYKDSTDAQIKQIVYLTKPMKYMLREERAGRNMIKVPVMYKNKTADQVGTIDSGDEQGPTVK